MLRSLLRLSLLSHKILNFPTNNSSRAIRTSQKFYSEKNKTSNNRALVLQDPFQKIKDKNRNTYIEMIKIYIDREHVYRTGHVEFINAALKNMEEFGVNKDLEVYKSLIDVLPKGKFVSQNVIQSEFMHYPKQQQCIIDLLGQMEDNGVMPDLDMEDLLISIFGRRGFPLRKYWRMMYWMPKFKNLSPWPIPEPVPQDTFDLAKYAIERISSIDETSIVTVFQTADIPESIDDTWIVSAQSPHQKKLLDHHKIDKPIYVEGPFTIWIKEYSLNYFVLRADPLPVIEEEFSPDDVSNIKIPLLATKPPLGRMLKAIPSVHEQEDGLILSVCATGTSSKDSLLSWIRHLERDGNPNLEIIPVVFTLKSSTKEVVTFEEDKDSHDVERK